MLSYCIVSNSLGSQQNKYSYPIFQMRSLRIHNEIFTGHMDYFPNMANFIVGCFLFVCLFFNYKKLSHLESLVR